jgi:hypothetical protein
MKDAPSRLQPTNGGTADMFDYGTGRDPDGSYFGMMSYEHHVNLTNPVTLMGMQRPFLFGTTTLPVGRLGLFLPWLIRKCKAHNPQEGLGAPDCLKDYES